jgi:hypothetical protein
VIVAFAGLHAIFFAQPAFRDNCSKQRLAGNAGEGNHCRGDFVACMAVV